MKTRALLLALPLLALGVGGCRDNRASVSIHGICAVKPDCTFSGKCEAFWASNPAIDTAADPGGDLMLFLEVGNQLIDNTNKDTFRTNTNDAHVDEVIVEYQGVSLAKQVIATQQLIPTNGTSVIGVDVVQGSAATGTVLSSYVAAGGSEITAVVKLGGYWDDGSRWETGEFPIAIHVCSGCVGLCTTSIGCGTDGTLPAACQ